jgi:hypothetical protein
LDFTSETLTKDPTSDAIGAGDDFIGVEVFVFVVNGVGEAEGSRSLEATELGDGFIGVGTLAFVDVGIGEVALSTDADIEEVANEGLGVRLAEVEIGGPFVLLGSSVCLVGARRFGPRARPLVLCSSGADDEGGESLAVDTEVSLVPLLFAVVGGPRASIPANAGLKRPASLLDTSAGFVMPGSARGCGLASSTSSLDFLDSEADDNLEEIVSADGFR